MGGCGAGSTAVLHPVVAVATARAAVTVVVEPVLDRRTASPVVVSSGSYPDGDHSAIDVTRVLRRSLVRSLLASGHRVVGAQPGAWRVRVALLYFAAEKGGFYPSSDYHAEARWRVAPRCDDVRK